MSPQAPRPVPGRTPLLRAAAFAAAPPCLVLWASPPTALLAGLAFALGFGHPFAARAHGAGRWLLQACVVLLGFGMNLPEVLRLGLGGSAFAAVSIAATLGLGLWLGPRLALDRKTSALISAGTAICGGSAIAAVSSVIAASEAQVAVSIGTVFMLNAVALYAFPAVGHLLHLSQAQFGLWAGVAIHDISSVVGAGMSYGPDAMAVATAVKLSRTLWIVPITLALALALGRRRAAHPAPGGGGPRRRAGVAVPWFIALFLLASLLRGAVPSVGARSPELLDIARRGMVLVLFLIGASLSLRALRAVGWRTVAVGSALWAFISAGSLAAILALHLAP